MTGFNDDIGSWKIIAMPPWPVSTRRYGGEWMTSKPASSARPVRTQGPPSGNNPMTASDVMLLPHPDSPTSPRISPLPISKETDETMSVKSARVPIETDRSLTRSIPAISCCR